LRINSKSEINVKQRSKIAVINSDVGEAGGYVITNVRCLIIMPR